MTPFSGPEICVGTDVPIIEVRSQRVLAEVIVFEAALVLIPVPSPERVMRGIEL